MSRLFDPTAAVNSYEHHTGVIVYNFDSGLVQIPVAAPATGFGPGSLLSQRVPAKIVIHKAELPFVHRLTGLSDSDIVAVDGTLRPRPDGRALADSIEAVHSEGRLLMADVSTVDEGLAAQDAGADVVSTTLSGYTPDSPSTDEPDFDLLAALAGRLRIPVVAEGRIRTPAQASQAFQLGAWAVVVGTAITSPAWITRQFVRELPTVQALNT